MRSTRNCMFVVLLTVFAFAWSQGLAAGPIINSQCDWPSYPNVSIHAWGDCDDAENDCVDACYGCYEITPKHVSPWNCEDYPSTGDYAVNCDCHLI